ncbi:hypothetical protein M5G07_13375 [Serratia symbiotica]|nr:hypothetical protein [Serratia symbiotica]
MVECLADLTVFNLSGIHFLQIGVEIFSFELSLACTGVQGKTLFLLILRMTQISPPLFATLNSFFGRNFPVPAYSTNLRRLYAQFFQSDIRQNITLKLRLFGQADAVKQGVVEPIANS